MKKFTINDLKTNKVAIHISNEVDWEKFRNSLGKEYTYKEFGMSAYVIYDPTWCKMNDSEEREYVCLQECEDYFDALKKRDYTLITIDQLNLKD